MQCFFRYNVQHVCQFGLVQQTQAANGALTVMVLHIGSRFTFRSVSLPSKGEKKAQNTYLGDSKQASEHVTQTPPTNDLQQINPYISRAYTYMSELKVYI